MIQGSLFYQQDSYACQMVIGCLVHVCGLLLTFRVSWTGHMKPHVTSNPVLTAADSREKGSVTDLTYLQTQLSTLLTGHYQN